MKLLHYGFHLFDEKIKNKEFSDNSGFLGRKRI